MICNRLASQLAAGAILALVLSTAGFAQVRGAQMYDVPFGFTVGHTFCPPGRYTVRSMSPGVLRIENADCSKQLMFLAISSTTRSPKAHSTLIFTRLGAERFLSAVYSANELTYADLGTPSGARRSRESLAVVAAP